MDCCSKPDWPGTVKMIEDCGFKLPSWIMFAILDGKCSNVIIGHSDFRGIPFVDVEGRGYKSQRFLHPGKEFARQLVFNILNTDWEKKKEKEIQEWLDEGAPMFIRDQNESNENTRI